MYLNFNLLLLLRFFEGSTTPNNLEALIALNLKTDLLAISTSTAGTQEETVAAVLLIYNRCSIRGCPKAGL